MTLDDLDGRTNAAKSVGIKIDRMVADLGGVDRVSETQMAVIRNVAILALMIEHEGTRYCNGDPVDFTAYSHLVAQQRRLLAELGIVKQPDNDGAYGIGNGETQITRKRIVDPNNPANCTSTLTITRRNGGAWESFEVADNPAIKADVELETRIVTPGDPDAADLVKPYRPARDAAGDLSFTFELDRPEPARRALLPIQGGVDQ